MTVKQAVEDAVTEAPLRVFVLGIGSTTSSAMCEGIAEAGNGICLMSTTTESIIGKCSRLVRASRTYVLRNVSVDWGVCGYPEEASSDNSSESRVVRQAPAVTPMIYPGNRFVVFALVDVRNFVAPREIIVRAQRDGQGEVFEFSVPLQLIDFPPDHPHPQLIPTLAAHRAISDLQGSALASSIPDAKVTITRLGVEYQLASRYTSFIAVDNRSNAEIKDSILEQGSAPYTQSVQYAQTAIIMYANLILSSEYWS